MTRSELEGLSKPELVEVILALQAAYERLERRLGARVAELERQLAQNRRNSQRPHPHLPRSGLVQPRSSKPVFRCLENDRFVNCQRAICSVSQTVIAQPHRGSCVEHLCKETIGSIIWLSVDEAVTAKGRCRYDEFEG